MTPSSRFETEDSPTNNTFCELVAAVMARLAADPIVYCGRPTGPARQK
jgi:hypothetical protein